MNGDTRSVDYSSLEVEAPSSFDPQELAGSWISVAFGPVDEAVDAAA